MKKTLPFLLVCMFMATGLQLVAQKQKKILPGAYQTEKYFPLLKNKRIGLFTNQTATINGKHLIDSLTSFGMTIQAIFTPEHGLRGTADAGEKVSDEVDPKTGIKVVSLYGKKSSPSAEDLQDIDILLFDVQDVGTRFYTYMNSLQYFMESALANHKPLILLDRPNPNGHFVDGPVLEKPFSSGVGKNTIPSVYGMTLGEYAKMLVGENWLKNEKQELLTLTIIANKNYTHLSKYIIDVAPSPNLSTMNSIYWYGTTCLIEGTVLSEGRGTEHAFAYIGHPSITQQNFSFTPMPRVGALSSKLYGQKCYGWDLSKKNPPSNKIDIQLIIEIYKSFPQKDSFFIRPKSGEPTAYFFNKLAGNASLMEQLKSGASEAVIRKSWEPALSEFKLKRKKYLIYKDFE